MKDYILLYGNKKQEDNIIIRNMFKNNKQINLGLTDFDNHNNMKVIDNILQDGTKQIIFLGLEIGWDKLIQNLKAKYINLIIKVICNTRR